MQPVIGTEGAKAQEMKGSKPNRRYPIPGVDSPCASAPSVGEDHRAGSPNPAHPGEEGYVLLVAIFLMALLVIALALAAPRIARSIQRDRDLETYHRGLQYRRAIQLYYRRFNAYPPNVDALVQTNNMRFLRRKYIDPSTGKDDWKPIQFGQNKTPTAMGFFGQPLSGGASTIAGIGPSGGNGVNASGGSLPGPMATLFGGSPSPSPSNPGGSSFMGGPTSGSTGTSGATGATGGGSTDNPGSSGSGTGGVGGLNSSPGAGGTGSPTSGFGAGQTFGGAGIIGFSPASPNLSILIYKKKQHYNEWEFTWDPISELKGIAGALGGQPGGTNPFGNPGGIGPQSPGGIGSQSPGGLNSPGSGPLPMNPAPMPPDMSAPPQQ